MATSESAKEQTIGSPPWTPVTKTGRPEETVIPAQGVIPPEEPQAGTSMPLSTTTDVERPAVTVPLELATVLTEPPAAQAAAPALGQTGQSGPGASFVMAPFVLAGLRRMLSPLVGGHPVGSAAPSVGSGQSRALVPFGGGAQA